MADNLFKGTAGALISSLQEAKRAADAGKLQGLLRAGEHVLGVSNTQVPHEDGDFERSGGVSQDKSTGMTAVSYDDTAYKGQAAQLHEDDALKHDAGRNAKFLENAMNSEREVVRQLVATAIRGKLGL